ncbi:hypothetical protein HPB48_019394 [Haemaphysalis longicornis]|uniref:SH3 domain-containing protein n=1 Tax=Haemaphysalis longicornis TaxID=44386 RepID=A0A9J6GQ46_HAELO|nr:hypothetical protein HPB48_019394 [Haemaphysalis longicornis]
MGKESDGGGIGVVDNYSEEEFSKYDMGSRSGAPRPAARHQVAGRYHGQRGEPPVQHSGMGYQERPRPTSPTPPSRAMRPLVEDEPPAGRGPYGRQSGGGGRGQRQPRVRWFVALFDYDPQTMSPNPDTADEELPFQEGELIKVLPEYFAPLNRLRCYLDLRSSSILKRKRYLARLASAKSA